MSRFGKLIIGAFILAVCTAVLGWWVIFASRTTVAPSTEVTFEENIAAVMRACVEEGTTSRAFKIGEMAASSIAIGEQRILDCLYEQGVTMELHGEPVRRRRR